MPGIIRCPGCGAEMPEGLSECPHCNEMLAGLEAEKPVRSTALPLVGAGISIVLALLWGGIALFQLAMGSLGGDSEFTGLGAWNLVICVLIAAGSIGLFMRKQWGYQICLWSATINAASGAYQVYTGAWLVAPIVLLSIVAAVILFMAWGEFK